MYSEELTAAAGSVSQVREITSQVMRICKSRNITTIIIGHVTKEGNIAGPRVLEHMVDTVLYLEGERYFSYRILRGVKNRFGSTNEIGMFEMREEGMCEITNPSDVLISEREDNPAGSCIVACMEGTRPMLVELQALTTQTIYGFPKRTANGIDYNRLAILIAVIEKKTGLSLGTQDVYVNVVGGLRINEPSIDLGIIIAVASIYKNKPIPKDCVIIGEVGLTGEVRRVNMIEKRIKEAEKLGFKKCIIPDRYILEDTDVVLNKANQGVQTLERYKKVFDSKLSILNEYEFNDIVTLENVIVAIQRAEMVMRIVQDIQSQIYELGNDGRLVKMQLEELIGGVEKEELLIIKDYLAVTKKKKTPETVMEELSEVPYEELTKQVTVAKLLGYENFDNYDEVGVYTRGYRILSKIPRMPSNIVENLVLSYKSFQQHISSRYRKFRRSRRNRRSTSKNNKTIIKKNARAICI